MLKVQHLSAQFSDERGVITRILEIEPKVKVALLISSKAGSIRANHYHKHDVHYTYLLTGKFEYFEKENEKESTLEKQVILPGDMVISESNKIHAMKFLEDSTMIVFSTEPRDHVNYEKDTVRVALV